MDPTTAILLLLAALFGAFSGLVIGAGLVWLLRPFQPPALDVPPSPLIPADPSIPEPMRKALKDAPTLFATARNMEAIRIALACKVCGEGSQLRCPVCGLRLCPTHLDCKEHSCTGVKAAGDPAP